MKIAIFIRYYLTPILSVKYFGNYFKVQPTIDRIGL